MSRSFGHNRGYAATLAVVGMLVGLAANPSAVSAQQANSIVPSNFHSYVPADALKGSHTTSSSAVWRSEMRLARNAWQQGEFTVAHTHFKNALDKGNLVAAWYLGHLYQYGKGVKPNKGRAFRYYRKVALSYDDDEPRRGQFRVVVDALVRVADAYRTGLPKYGIKRDPRRAFNIYNVAASHQHPAAYYGLGVIYLKGIGMKQRTSHARRWLGKAAAYRFVPATAMLGDMNWGAGKSAKGRVEGLKWYLLAQQSANPEVHPKVFERLDQMLSKVSSKERAKAEMLAVKFDAAYPVRAATAEAVPSQ